MSNALRRGRTLDPDAVRKAKQWRQQRIAHLKSRLADGTITMEERKELRWKWGESLVT